MSDECGLQVLGRARLTVARIREALQRPAPRLFDEVQPLLERAASDLRRFNESTGRGPDPVLLHAADELRSEVRQLRVLLDSLASFCWGWTRLLYGMACEYTPQGLAVSPRPAPRILAEG